MKKTLAMMMVLAIMITAFPLTTYAAGKLSVDQENFYVIDGFWRYAYAYAKVSNTGDKPVSVNAGVVEVFNEEGDVITSEDYLHKYAEVLQPGEYTYASMSAEIEEEGVVAADYTLTITGKADQSAEVKRLPCTTDLKLNEQNGWWTYNYMYATITNDTGDPMYDISVVFALLDAEGNILYIDDDNLYSDRALMPGSSMIIRKDISSSFMEYFEANEIVPASVDAIAYVTIES